MTAPSVTFTEPVGTGRPCDRQGAGRRWGTGAQPLESTGAQPLESTVPA